MRGLFESDKRCPWSACKVWISPRTPLEIISEHSTHKNSTASIQRTLLYDLSAFDVPFCGWAIRLLKLYVEFVLQFANLRHQRLRLTSIGFDLQSNLHFATYQLLCGFSFWVPSCWNLFCVLTVCFTFHSEFQFVELKFCDKTSLIEVTSGQS